jgi:hypothetical protein
MIARQLTASFANGLSGYLLLNFNKSSSRTRGNHEPGEYPRMEAYVLDLVSGRKFWSFIVRESLQQSYRVSARYVRICFDRALALRTRDCELGGLGHPLVDALINRVRQPDFLGEVCTFGPGKSIRAQFLAHRRDEKGPSAWKGIQSAVDKIQCASRPRPSV